MRYQHGKKKIGILNESGVAFCVVSGSLLTKNGINEKGKLYLVFILLGVAACIIRDSRRIAVTVPHVSCQLRVPHWCNQPVVKLIVGSISTLQKSRDTMLNSQGFGFIFKMQTKVIHHCENAPSTSHSHTSLTIQVLVFAVANHICGN